jgi:hypothetical protein
MATITYLIYLALVLFVVVVVGRYLTTNGRFFLLDVLGEEHLADNTNRILFFSYCLLNAGGAFWCLNTAGEIKQFQDQVEYIFTNQGKLLLLLGIMHLLNLLLLPHLKQFLRPKQKKTEQ